MTIGIELNHVLRNINRQLLKYYEKGVDPSMDSSEIDDKTNVIENVLKFPTKKDKYNFIYVDYPYEIFGCANVCEKNLAVGLSNWLVDLENLEKDDLKVILYSLDEDALSIQSTYFFLSKIGCRVREMFFPKSESEVLEKCDCIITTRRSFLENDSDCKVILIKREWNEDLANKAFFSCENLSEVFGNTDLITKLYQTENSNG